MEKEKVCEQLKAFKDQMSKLESLLENSSSVLNLATQKSYQDTIAQIKALVQSLEEKINKKESE